MPKNPKEDLKLDKNIQFLKYLSVVTLSVVVLLLSFILVNKEYYKEILYLNIGVVAIIFIIVFGDKFDFIKIGNYLELRKMKSDFDKKNEKILTELKNVQIQISNIKMVNYNIACGGQENYSGVSSPDEIKEYSDRNKTA